MKITHYRAFFTILVVFALVFAVIGCSVTAIDKSPSHTHEWGAWTVTIPATATENGEETRTCLTCGETETRIIPATGDNNSGNLIPINTINIRITAPAKGDSPAATASGTGDFTIGMVSWSPDHDPFLGETVYIATVTLTAENTYTFTGLSHTKINGQSAEIEYNNGTTATLSYTFPATLAQEVTALAIKTQPNKLTYTHGETLDLSGLTVTLTYDDGITDDVGFGDFNGKGITTIPAHGEILSRSVHDRQPVTAEQGSHTADTNNLTVNKAAGVTVTPELVSKTHNSITVSSTATTTGQTVQFAISNTSGTPANGWQNSGVFTSLDANTIYYVFAHTVESANYTGVTGSPLQVTTLQAGSSQFAYYWVDEHDNLIINNDISVVVQPGEVLEITAVDQTSGYTVLEWYLNGTLLSGHNGNSYLFSSTESGMHDIGMVAIKDGKIYSSNIIIIVRTNVIIFSENFEETSSFILVNGSQTNQWRVGTTTAYAGTRSAYISNNSGSSNAYTITSSSTVHMYRDVTFPASSEPYTLSFYWKCQGENGYDYLRVFLVNATVTPTAGSTSSLGTALGTYNLGGTGWNQATVSIPASNSGTTRRLVFTWINDSSVGTQPPAAVDNIELRMN